LFKPSKKHGFSVTHKSRLKIKTLLCFHWLEASATGAEKQRLSTMGRSCAFGSKNSVQRTADSEQRRA